MLTSLLCSHSLRALLASAPANPSDTARKSEAKTPALEAREQILRAAE
jgi:hypothetical protein